jgi:hypothetical protein
MRNRIFVRKRDRLRARPLFRDESVISERLMRPGPITRISDWFVSFLSRFEDDDERELINTDPSESRRPVRTVVALTVFTVLFSVFGTPNKAALFFGSQATLLITIKAWFDWHRKNPPEQDSSSTWKGVRSALIHAAGAFTVGAVYMYALSSSIPVMASPSNWIEGLELLMVPSALAVLTYQRRTAWNHDDPEIGMIIGAVALVAYVAFMIARALFG